MPKYERYRFAEVFAGVKRAPERLAARIADIWGVQTVETRVTALSTVDVAGVVELVTAALVSLPDAGEPLLNRVALRAGRCPSRGSSTRRWCTTGSASKTASPSS